MNSFKLITEPYETYHERRREYITSHSLYTYQQNPAAFRRLALGLWPPKKSASMDLGTAFHIRVLEGEDAYRQQVGVTALDRRTKAYKDWFAGEGTNYRVILSYEQADALENMREAVRKIELPELREISIVGEWQGVRVQARIDAMGRNADRVVDLKTCASFEAAKPYMSRYQLQLAFYAWMARRWKISLGERFFQDAVVPSSLVMVETSEPYRAAVVENSGGDSSLIEELLSAINHRRINDNWTAEHETYQSIKEFTDAN